MSTVATTEDQSSNQGKKRSGEAYTSDDEALRRYQENPDPTPAPEASERIERVEVTDEHVVFSLRDGRVVMVPLTWSWRLLEATEEERQNFKISPSGYGVRWPDVDEDLSGRGALRGMPAPRPGSRPGLRARREAAKKTLAGKWTPGRIKQLRRRMGLTQEAFARRMGTRQATISEWENANQEPSPMALRLLEMLQQEKQS